MTQAEFPFLLLFAFTRKKSSLLRKEYTPKASLLMPAEAQHTHKGSPYWTT